MVKNKVSKLNEYSSIYPPHIIIVKVLKRLEYLLIKTSINRSILTYTQVAQLLEFQPPCTIHQTTEYIEAMMRIHANTGVPQLSSLIISKMRGGLPAPGFFLILQQLGLYEGSVDGADARQFHAQEIQRCLDKFC